MRASLGAFAAPAGQHLDAFGMSWADISVSSLTYYFIAQAGNTLISVSDCTANVTNRIGRSTDGGLNWTYHDAGSDANGKILACVAGNGSGTWIAATYTGNKFIVSTDDGITWSNLTGPTGTGTPQWLSASYGNGTFVFINGNRGAGGHHAYSTDNGTTITASTGESANDGFSSIFDGTNFIVGCDSKILISADGQTWTQVSPSQSGIWFVAANSAHAIAVDLNGTGHSMTSSNHGASWANGGATGSNTYRGAAYASGGTAIAISSDGTHRSYKTTDHGTTWILLDTASQEDWHTISPAGIHLVTASASGKLNRI